MFRGLNTATSGMIAQQRRQDALSHNLANMNTPGFKRDHAVLRSFPEMLLQRIDKSSAAPMASNQLTPIGSLSTGIYNQELVPLFDTGDLVETSKPLDFAIEDSNLARNLIDGRYVKPSIFFVVQTSSGEIEYTRNGNFTVDGNGNVVTSDGSLALDPFGNPLFVDDPESFDATQLGLARVENPLELVRSGSDRYRFDEGDNPPEFLPAGGWDGFSIRKGMIERSNVDPGQTVAEMMVTMRSYESNQKVIQSYDRTMELLNSIGRLG